MIPDLVSELTGFISPSAVFVFLIALVITDYLDIYSDAGRKFDIIFRTMVIVAAGYIVISAGSLI